MCPENTLSLKSFDFIEPLNGDIINSSHLRVKLGYLIDDPDQFNANKHLLQLCLFYGGRKQCFPDIYRDYSVLLSSPAGHSFEVVAILCAANDPNYCYCTATSIASVTQSVEAKATSTPLCLQAPKQVIKAPPPSALSVLLLVDGGSLGARVGAADSAMWESLRSVVAAANFALTGVSRPDVGAVDRVTYTVVVRYATPEQYETAAGHALAYAVRESVWALSEGGGLPEVALYACAPHEARSLLQCGLFSAQAASSSPTEPSDVLLFVRLSERRRVFVRTSAVTQLVAAVRGNSNGGTQSPNPPPPCLVLGNPARAPGAGLVLTDRFLTAVSGAGPTHWLPAAASDLHPDMHFAVRRDALLYFRNEWLVAEAEIEAEAGTEGFSFEQMERERVSTIAAHPALFL